MYKFNGHLSTKDSKLWSNHIDVPHDIAMAIREARIQRLDVTYNGTEKSHCSLLSHGDGNYYILINQERIKNLGVAIGAMIEVTIKEDTSTYGMPMP